MSPYRENPTKDKDLCIECKHSFDCNGTLYCLVKKDMKQKRNAESLALVYGNDHPKTIEARCEECSNVRYYTGSKCPNFKLKLQLL